MKRALSTWPGTWSLGPNEAVPRSAPSQHLKITAIRLEGVVRPGDDLPSTLLAALDGQGRLYRAPVALARRLAWALRPGAARDPVRPSATDLFR